MLSLGLCSEATRPSKPSTAPPRVPRPHLRKVREPEEDRLEPKRQRDHSLERKLEAVQSPEEETKMLGEEMR